MIFVPISLFACVFLLIVLGWFVRTQGLDQRAHQLFALLIALYAAQSFWLSLRWGYGIEVAGTLAALSAPVLPVVAYLAYGALNAPLSGRRLWPLAVIVLHWLSYGLSPDLADAVILLTYFGFGTLLIVQAVRGPDRLALSPLDNARWIVIAMGVTGIMLIGSALVDVSIIVDFLRNEGRHAGLIISVIQTGLVLIIGLSAAFGRIAEAPQAEPEVQAPLAEDVAEEDAAILARLERLFVQDHLHRDEELSLRRLARKLGLPDRRVSNAINRQTGLSVSQFVNEHRIKDACTLLITTEDTVLAVSLTAGFASKSNFNREFARVTGVSPSVWRGQNRA